MNTLSALTRKAAESEMLSLIDPLAEYIVEATDSYVKFAFPPGVMAHDLPLRKLLKMFREVDIGWNGQQNGALMPGMAATYTLYYRHLL